MNMCRRRLGDGSKALICKLIRERERHIKYGLISGRRWRTEDKKRYPARGKDNTSPPSSFVAGKHIQSRRRSPVLCTERFPVRKCDLNDPPEGSQMLQAAAEAVVVQWGGQ